MGRPFPSIWSRPSRQIATFAVSLPPFLHLGGNHAFDFLKCPCQGPSSSHAGVIGPGPGQPTPFHVLPCPLCNPSLRFVQCDSRIRPTPSWHSLHFLAFRHAGWPSHAQGCGHQWHERPPLLALTTWYPYSCEATREAFRLGGPSRSAAR